MTAILEPVLDAELVFDPDFEGVYETDWNFDQATAATEHINGVTSAYVENMDELFFDAFSHRVWRAMGFESWDLWRASLKIRKSTSERRQLAAKMARRGMSTRAIGSALGVSQKTADRDVRAARESNDSADFTDSQGEEIEESGTILGSDGKTYTKKFTCHRCKSRTAFDERTEIDGHLYCESCTDFLDAGGEIITEEGELVEEPLKSEKMMKAFASRIAKTEAPWNLGTARSLQKAMIAIVTQMEREV
jgi:predicted transcriptional regulator